VSMTIREKKRALALETKRKGEGETSLNLHRQDVESLQGSPKRKGHQRGGRWAQKEKLDIFESIQKGRVDIEFLWDQGAQRESQRIIP